MTSERNLKENKHRIERKWGEGKCAKYVSVFEEKEECQYNFYTDKLSIREERRMQMKHLIKDRWNIKC
jgi:hypothetical protein